MDSAKLKQWGATLMFIGGVSFILPMIGFQFRLLNLFGGGPGGGIFIAIVGGVLFAIGSMKEKAQSSPGPKPATSGQRPPVTPPSQPVPQPKTQPKKNTIRCSGCGAENDEGRRFCHSCGTALIEAAPPSAPICAGCGAPLTLEDRFCGECGKPRQSTVQTIPTTQAVNASDLFPLCGVTLGKTTVQELARLGARATGGKTKRRASYNYYVIDGNNFWYSEESGIATHMYIAKGVYLIPKQWQTLGFDWRHPYNDWFGLLQRLGFSITVEEAPRVVKYRGQDSFNAKLRAVRQTKMPLIIELGFNYSDQTKPDSQGMLYSMTVKIP